MRIHFVGASGVSMRALSDIARSIGHTVTGSDRSSGGHDPKNVEGSELVVYTNAVPEDNCELVRAKQLGIPIVERARYLGELSKSYKTVIAVAGCHGKSTATAMLGSIFFGLGATVHVGAPGASVFGGSQYLLTEACEYRESFLQLSPDVGVVLNVQLDHPDYYRSQAELTAAYKRFCARCKKVIVNGDDPRAASLVPSPVTFGLSKACDYRAEEITAEGGRRTFMLAGRRRARIALSVPGEHNVYNALAAAAAACECSLPTSNVVHGLNRYTGLPRRFEYKGTANGKAVFTDYAHHPTEIAAGIRTARELFPSVAVVFQPHTYSRTKALLNDFAAALSAADAVVLAPIYPAREKPLPGVTSQELARLVAQKTERVYCFDSFDKIVEVCRSLKQKALIVMGAGNVDIIADMLCKG